MSAGLQTFLLRHWQSIVLYGAALIIVAGALAWQLGSLTPGYSMTEAVAYHSSMSLRAIFENPLNAPFLLATKAASLVLPDTFLAVRAVAAGFGLATLVLFATLLRVWHDRHVAIIGTLLFGLSAWFLHTARFGSPEVLLFGVFALAVAGYWLKRTESWFALVVCMIATALLLYTPGMVWFIGVGIIWQWKVIDRIFKKHLLAVTLAGVAMLGMLVPLGLALYKQHVLIKPWLALPHQWPNPIEMVGNLIEVPIHLLIGNRPDAVTWLGNAPILDVFSLAMFVLGAYLYLRNFKLIRTSLFIGIFIVMAALMMVGSPITFSVIIPFMYLVVAAGVAYLIGQWFKVFPRNPIARASGRIVLYAVIGLVITYHLTHYFVGWPGAQATHDVFFLQKP